MSGNQKHYGYGPLAVFFKPKRCIQSEHCLRRLPRVFDRKRQPWIDVSQADAEQVVASVMDCPSGALRFEHLDGHPQEPRPNANVATPAPDGPLLVRGDILLKRPDQSFVSEKRVALCRCGASKNKPYCDNSHKSVAFQEPGQLKPEPGRSVGPAPAETHLEIRPARDGPLLILGPLTIRTADGQSQEVVSRCALCRCGAASDMPYCDGMHGRVRFRAI